MNRRLALAVGQLGPIARSESRASVVRRLIVLLRQAKDRGCRLVVFPEMALTTFFPRWHIEDEAELDSFFERDMPGPETRPLFEEAARLRDEIRRLESADLGVPIGPKRLAARIQAANANRDRKRAGRKIRRGP